MTLAVHYTRKQADLHWLPGPYRAFVGGYGAGKSLTLESRALQDVLTLKLNTAVYAPTFDLLKRATIVDLDDMLTRSGLSYSLNKSEFVYDIAGYGQIWLRSIDRPERIVAYQTATAHIDEIDTIPTDKAEDVWRRVLARTRTRIPGHRGKNPVSCYTTPDGRKFTYKRWSSRDDALYQYVRAPTHSNPYAGTEYVDTLRRAYPAQHIAAYVEGHWVNLTTGAVFPDFDRDLNGCDTVALATDTLHIGMDFNAGKMAAVVYVLRMGPGGELDPHAVDEFVGLRDTPDVIQSVRKRYPQHAVVVYPDAVGQRSTSVSDVALLSQAGFRIVIHEANPLVRDRVLAANTMICNADGLRRLRVNASQCAGYVDALEQISYRAGQPDKTSGLDHVIDAGTYPLEHLYPVVRPVVATGVRTAQSREFRH